MAICANSKAHYVGQDVLVTYLTGCPDTPPALTDSNFKFIGATKTKSLSFGTATIDTTTDATPDSVGSSIVAGATFELSVDGLARLADASGEGHTALVQYFHAEIAAGRQPSVWIKAVFPDLTYLAYCLITDYKRDAPNRESVTFSVTFTGTDVNPAVTVTA